MAKASQEEILDRRLDMLFLDRMGIHPKDWIHEIAFKHHTTPEAVRRDWSRRSTWMKQIVRLEDAEALALDVLYDYERALQDTYQLFTDAQKVSEKIHTLWARLKAIQMREQYLRSIGAFDQIKIDFAYASETHREEKEEEKYPFLKGDRDKYIRYMALLKNNNERVFPTFNTPT